MRENGDSPAEIAGKTGLVVSYVNGILKLLAKGEERLLGAVRKGKSPSVSPSRLPVPTTQAVQGRLAEAYEKKELRGKALLKLVGSSKRGVAAEKNYIAEFAVAPTGRSRPSSFSKRTVKRPIARRRSCRKRNSVRPSWSSPCRP